MQELVNQLCMIQFCLLPCPLGQTQEQVQSIGPGDGEFLEAVLPPGIGAGQIENNFLLFLWTGATVNTMAPGARGEYQIEYFSQSCSCEKMKVDIDC